MNKNKKQLESFTKYCVEHPQERFWQALRSWSGSQFILKAESFDMDTNEWVEVVDTFWE